jgi:tripartite-type tricarboxylate transporter receptor subunit TctC
MLSLTQTKTIHVPCRGSVRALADAVARRVSVAVESQAATLPMANSGKLCALAVASAKRGREHFAAPRSLQPRRYCLVWDA